MDKYIILARRNPSGFVSTSSLQTSPDGLRVMGALQHGALIKPMGAESARVWRDWLTDFIENEEQEND